MKVDREPRAVLRAWSLVSSKMSTRSLTNLLSLPDDVLGLILIDTLEKSFAITPDKAWCRTASTCRRLWHLRFPSTPEPIRLCCEKCLLKA